MTQHASPPVRPDLEPTHAGRPTTVVPGTTEPEARGPARPARRSPISRWRRFGASITTRLLVSYVVLLTVSTVLSLAVVRQILHIRVDEEVAELLVQEVSEFRRLVGGDDPSTGEPFGRDLKAIFDVFFRRNIPQEGEMVIGIVGDEVRQVKRAHDATFPLERRTELIAGWSRLEQPAHGEIRTPLGVARYLAVPVVLEGETLGAFIVVNFPGFEHAEIDRAMRLAIATAAVVLIVALLLAWALARRVLDPVRLLATTTRSITETDLTRRITVRGADEVSQLAGNFNEMLDRLETAFRAQRQFVDDAGHELRTPITIVRGHLELLEDDPQQRQETIALVTDELDRMSRIVNDLLVLARSQQPEFLDLDLVEVAEVTEQVHAKATALGDRGWQIERVGHGHILADHQRLTQAIMQLAQNAVDHTGSGERIWIGSAMDEGEARFWVRDEGSGIALEEQERIFDRFARANDTMRASSGGAGLGLAIVRAIAEAHHGRVELESTPGAGATFTIVLPISQPSAMVGGAAGEMGP